MKSLVWILGRGGFLGSHLAKELDAREAFALWNCQIAFSWDDHAKIQQEFSQAVSDFLATLKHRDLKHWTIIWAAGRGVIASDDASLQKETDVWKILLERVTEQCTECNVPGTIFLSSSAGALYVDQEGEVTESSTPTPLSEYGKQKFLQEEILLEWVSKKQNINALVGRISSLYGTAQGVSKPQGLIAHMAMSIIKRQPIHIFVPLDTTRDYHDVSDCARDIVTCLERRSREPDPKLITKIFASKRPTSIAELIAIFTRIAKRNPRIALGAHTQQKLHGRHLRLTSTQWRDAEGPVTSLPAGIHRLYQHQLQSRARGSHTVSR